MGEAVKRLPVVGAVSMFHNEEDTAEGVVRHLLEQGVAPIIVADNLSTDGTRAILDGLAREYPTRFGVMNDPEPLYHQGQKMTALAQIAWQNSAEWIIPFDADELWSGAGGRPIPEVLAQHGDLDLCPVVYWEYVPQPEDDQREHDPFVRIRHREPFAKIGYKHAVRWRDDAFLIAGNHLAGRCGTRGRGGEPFLEVAHYSARSREQAWEKYRHGRSVIPPNWTKDMGAHWRDRGSSEAAFDAFWQAFVATEVEDCPAPYRGRRTSLSRGAAVA